jgi:multicomponent Na+:H+ antiporter subunit E
MANAQHDFSMNRSSQLSPPGITRLATATALLLATWLLLAGSLHWQEVLVGVLVAIAIAYLSRHKLALLDDLLLTPTLPWHLLRYLGVFLRALLESNIDMARRVLSPSLPIRPALVEVHTELKSPLGRLLLANSITLTPGTLTVEVSDDRLRVHWIDASPGEDLATATRLIVERFEQPLKRCVR